MLWPIPINIRMNPAFASSLLDVNAQCASEEREIFDFPEYGASLDARQLIRLRAFAAEVIRSHDSQSPIAAISILGHADRALREPIGNRSRKEQQVSDARARNGLEQFEKMMKDLPGGPRVLAMIHTKPKGVGSSNLAVQHPLNDEQMRRNRRIVFRWSRCLLPAPIIHPIPEFTPPSVKPEDNPNTIFAGTRFKMKILSGVSAGEILGGFSYHFLIVDPVNRRSAEYTYRGVIVTVGVPPFTECGESDFSDEFTTLSPIQVNQFSAPDCSHVSGSIGIVSGMRFTFGRGTSDATLKMDPSQRTVGIFAGPSKSLGVETAKSASLSVIPGSVAVVK